MHTRISGEERRKQILAVALSVCAKNGFSGTTLDDIADEAGVSRTLIVQHFGSKEGLYEALSEALGSAHSLEEDLEVRRGIEKKDDYAVFRACAAHIFENNLRDPQRCNLRLVVFCMLEYPELFEKFSRVRDGAWEGVIAYIEARQREGAIAPVDARRLVEGFRSMVIQVASEALYREERPNRERFYRVVDAMIWLLLAGLRNQHATTAPTAARRGYGRGGLNED
jgi:AcrR family transcriptional regulator